MHLSRLSITLLILNVCLYSWIIWIQDSGDDNDPSYANTLYFDTSSVTQIEMRSVSEADLKLSKEGSRWNMKEPFQWPANEAAIQRLLNQLSTMKPIVSLKEDDISDFRASMSSYGLEQPFLDLRLDAASSSKHFQFGQSSSAKAKIYLHDRDTQLLHVLDNDFLNQIDLTSNAYRKKSIFQIPLYEIQSIAIRLHAENVMVRLLREGDQWLFESPFTATADKQQVDAFLNMLKSLEVVQFIDNDPNTSETVAPNASISITLSGPRKRETLVVSNTPPEEALNGIPLQLAQLESLPATFALPAAPFQTIRDHWEALRNRQFLDYPHMQTSSIELSNADKRITIQKLETGDWQLVDGNDPSEIKSYRADGEWITECLKALSEIAAIQYISDAPSEKDIQEYGFVQPTLKIDISGAFGRRTLEIGSELKEQDEHYARILGENSIYSVSSQILDVFSVDGNHYRDRNIFRLPENAELVAVHLDHGEHSLVSIERSQEGIWKSTEPNSSFLASTLAHLTNELKVLNAEAFIREPTNTPQWNYSLSIQYKIASQDASTIQERKFIFTTENGLLQYGQTLSEGIFFKPEKKLIEAFDAVLKQKLHQ